jgi:predicted DNA-binding transcriptional regulator AlpA
LMDRLLTVPQLAEVLQVPQSWIYQQTRRRGEDQIPVLYVGKYCRFQLRAVLTWLEKRNGGRS